LQHRGLALSTSVTMMVNFGQLLWALRRRVPELRLRELGVQFARVLVAAAGFAAAAWACVALSAHLWPAASFLRRAVVLIAASVAGTLVFLLLCSVFQV